ncbi:uncharacterized protein F58A4.6 [Condylostylus longicornis]|uniref:uncharacterized protein F58A4.6 n=1 Tax=Condylostylus longicornis TaxID=2530218 RepID=UPI00244E572F|nr:uncharacterized protein F58A4.6 [Condylostylus longicornis]
MMISMGVIDCFKQNHSLEITKESVIMQPSDNFNIKNYPVRRIKISPIQFYFFYKEITNWNKFIDKLLKNQYLLEHFIRIRLLTNSTITIDYTWSRITYMTLMENIETEHIFLWLSTLGGGYSSLGEHFSSCAIIASKISLQQLILCYKLGDPNMQSRCKLFYSISLIQQGKLRLAKKIIREQYKFAKSQTVEDFRLIKMCQGIWLKLQHSYRIRLIGSDSK